MSDHPELRSSASGVLASLKEAFSWKSKPTEAAPAVSAATAPVLVEPLPQPKKVEEVVAQVAPVPEEEVVPDWLNFPAEEPASPEILAQSQAETISRPLAVPTVVGLKLPEASIAEVPEIPDWLSALRSKDSDVPTLVGSPPVLAAEVPAASAVSERTAAVEPPAVPVAPESVEAKVEVDPFAANKEFNGYMETIRQALETLASGTALNPDQEKQAKIAAGKANTLLPKLPADVLQSVILMKAVSSNNPKYGRQDFQREMLGVVKIIVAGPVKKG